MDPLNLCAHMCLWLSLGDPPNPVRKFRLLGNPMSFHGSGLETYTIMCLQRTRITILVLPVPRSDSFGADILMLFPMTSLALNRAVTHGLTPTTFQQALPTIRLALTTNSTPCLVKSRWLRQFVSLKALLHERNRERWRYRGSHRIFGGEIPSGKIEGVTGWKSSLPARTNGILAVLNRQGDLGFAQVRA